MQRVFAPCALSSETVLFVSDPGFPRIWLIHFQASVSRLDAGFPEDAFLVINASLFTAEAVVHFSGQPAVCVNRLDGSVIQDRGEVVWNNIADGTVAGSFDGTAMDGVPDGDVVPQQKFLLFLDGGWNVFLSQAR